MMQHNQLLTTEKVQYTFTRVKDTYEENGQKFITLFGRLTVQNDGQSKSAWVEIEEVKWEQATEKLKNMPDAMYMFNVSKQIFKDLLQIASSHHQELYCLTPVYVAREYNKLGS
ncbi:hypothetical protein QWY22_04730 [Planococcus liqunii]|uniref:Uncharacterized protein n=1 Tax=Planococcus liqunii TaxID=3058394 RepID=A0ABT8MRJ9_9BACL|nr:MULTISPECIES: hypothetical protein [unclassified Planococcus (in: firmicutes)]MDN7227535.1 hypothetical protein [Planococcus sp. N064]WKA51914.1 hypothetical protein QWY22_04730 [Planococcus sp. N056]